MSISFDDLDGEEEPQRQNSRPIWTIDLDDTKNSEGILKWLVGEIDFLKQDAHHRNDEMKRHLSIYKNRVFADKFNQSKATQLFHGTGKQQITRMTVNHIYDLVEQVISRLVKFKPAVAFIPTHDEWEDKIAAKMADRFWSHIKDVQKIDDKVLKTARLSRLCGDGWLAVLWDKDSGGEHMDSKKQRGEGKEFVTLKDENGQPSKDENGNTIKVRLPIHIGDVVYKGLLPWNTYLQKADSFNETDYMFYSEVKDVDELRLCYPDLADQIKSGGKHKIFDFDQMEEVSLGNNVEVWTYWNKKTKGLPDGREIIFTKDVILENKELPYDHGKLPVVNLKDIEIPGERYGQSGVRNIRHMNQRINDLTTMIMRNQALVSHPKWFVPRGSVKIEALGNDVAIAQYQGSQPPVLAQQNPTPSEVFNFRNVLKEDMQQIYGVFGVSRGQPPAGIKAGIALQFLEEQENQRQNASTVTYNEFIRSLAEMTLGVAAQYYDASDDRTLMVAGPDGEWMVENLDPKMLTKAFSIRIQNASALPESKAARLQSILDISERFPDMFQSEQILEMLDMADSQKFFDAGTAAVRKAEMEDEKILSGDESMPPEEWEFHVEHWSVHSKTLQGMRYQQAAKKDREIFEAHVLAHEMFMVEKSLQNPVFAKRLEGLKQFPLMYTPPPPPVPPAPEEMGLSPSGVPAGAGAGLAEAASQEMPPGVETQAAVDPTGAVGGGTPVNISPEGIS